jgi:hypothetical protein
MVKEELGMCLLAQFQTITLQFYFLTCRGRKWELRLSPFDFSILELCAL